MSLYSPWNQTTYGFVMIWGEVKVNSRFPKDQQVDVFFWIGIICNLVNITCFFIESKTPSKKKVINKNNTLFKV